MARTYNAKQNDLTICELCFCEFIRVKTRCDQKTVMGNSEAPRLPEIIRHDERVIVIDGVDPADKIFLLNEPNKRITLKELLYVLHMLMTSSLNCKYMRSLYAHGL